MLQRPLIEANGSETEIGRGIEFVCGRDFLLIPCDHVSYRNAVPAEFIGSPSDVPAEKLTDFIVRMEPACRWSFELLFVQRHAIPSRHAMPS